MQHISTTPFGRRPVTAGLLAAQALAETGDGYAPVNKWQVLRELGLARHALGVTDRDLGLLSALISFHKEETIPAENAIVFPSNAVLSQRAHGMAESTLRRHLAALVQAGLIRRHDSPNGKRYAVRGMGEMDRAFGLDLSPLARRAPEISAAAREAALATETLRRQRESVVLRLRDCEKLVAYALDELPGCWDRFADAILLTKRSLRRKMEPELLQALDTRVTELLTELNQALIQQNAEIMTGNDSHNERHKQYSTISYPVLEPCEENARAQAAPIAEGEQTAGTETDHVDEVPALPLYLVLRACPDIEAYATGGVKTWADLVAAASFVRGMIGISPDAWEEACYHMGAAPAAVTVACILQSFERIGKPGGYLRALSRKAQEGAFTPGPMVMALLRTENSRAV